MKRIEPTQSPARSSSIKAKSWLALAVGVAFGMVADVASANVEGTPFESGANAAALGRLAQGATVKRSSADNTLTPEDRSRLRALNLPHAQSAAVVLHKINRTDGPRQIARLNALVRSVDKFAPSDACDGIVATGESRGVCTSHVDGPVGKVAVRMPVAAKLTEGQGGVIRLVMTNPLPMEAKPLFGWSEVVAPQKLKVVYEMFPMDDGWLVYVRLGVQMSKHEGSAKTISDALLKLEGWLTKELARS
jgi:hypothetical protein